MQETLEENAEVNLSTFWTISDINMSSQKFLLPAALSFLSTVDVECVKTRSVKSMIQISQILSTLRGKSLQF